MGLIDSTNLVIEFGGKTWNVTDIHAQATRYAIMCVVIACTISFAHIFGHVHYNKEAQSRKYAIRIVSMVPVYALDGLFALEHPHLSFMFGLFRCGYEAFVLYSFIQYLLTAVGGAVALAKNLQAQENGSAPTAACCGHKGASFVRCTVLGTLQYVPCMIFCIILSYMSWSEGKYEEGEFALDNGWFWVSLIQGISQTWALTCLAFFYQGVKHQLREIKPLLKFVAIKLVVFFTWYQAFMIYAIKSMDSAFLDSHAVKIENKHREIKIIKSNSWCLPVIGCMKHSKVNATIVQVDNAWEQDGVRNELGEDLGNFLICLEVHGMPRNICTRTCALPSRPLTHSHSHLCSTQISPSPFQVVFFAILHVLAFPVNTKAARAEANAGTVNPVMSRAAPCSPGGGWRATADSVTARLG
jgi:hypothetical protein